MSKKFLSLALAFFMLLAILPPTIIVSAQDWDYDEILENNLKVFNSNPTDAASLDFYTFPLRLSNITGYEKEVADLASLVTANAKNNYEKAKAINDWVAKNIYYDYDKLEYIKEEYDPEYSYSILTTLETKRNVCAGYTNVTVAMLRCVGIPAKYISGTAKSGGRHAWTEAYVDGRWMIIDTTWNSGNKYEKGIYKKGINRDKYFDISMEEFSRDHKYDDYIDTAGVNIGSRDIVLYLYDLKSLKRMTVPDCVTFIGDFAFYQCRSLANITISDNVTSIGNKAFNECEALTNIKWPKSLVSIGIGTFTGCTSLTEITMPDSLVSIGPYAFDGCTSLTKIKMPDSLVSIGNGAFTGCTSLTEITMPDSLVSIGNAAFDQCGLTSINWPSGVDSIGDYMFWKCENLESVTIPNTVVSIGYAAFYQCESLKSITIPDSVTSIGDYAFLKCGNLAAIYGKKGSYAEKYAKDNKIKFIDSLAGDDSVDDDDDPIIPDDPKDDDDDPLLDPSLATADEWARESIRSAIDKGIVPKEIQGDYTKIITRAEFCRMTVMFVEYWLEMTVEEIFVEFVDDILKEFGVTREDVMFTDTNDQYILIAYILGITNGTGDGKFTPNGMIDRQQAATMLARLCELFGVDISDAPDSGFADLQTADAWAIEGINFCYEYWIMLGTGDNKFSPKETYTRQQSIMTFDRIG